MKLSRYISTCRGWRPRNSRDHEAVYRHAYYVSTLLVVYYSGGETGHDEIFNFKSNLSLNVFKSSSVIERLEAHMWLINGIRCAGRYQR